MRLWKMPVLALVAGLSLFAAATAPFPDPVVDQERTATKGKDTAVFAGGCFWCTEAVFEHLTGVQKVISGYAGGDAAGAHYKIVGEGRTDHAESIEVTYDPSLVSYGQLLKIFFSVAHDPTQLNRQGPDSGTQYRSAIFYANEEQRHIAIAYIAQLQQAKAFSRPIVTQVDPLKAFYPAENYHQNYATLHPDDPYIAYNDTPKVEHLREQFPTLYKK